VYTLKFEKCGKDGTKMNAEEACDEWKGMELAPGRGCDVTGLGILDSFNTLVAACVLNTSLNDSQEKK
jgi:hypothetical protein